jgi:hypothetical protein
MVCRLQRNTNENRFNQNNTTRDPQAVVQREMMVSNQEQQQFTNEIRREDIASGRKTL